MKQEITYRINEPIPTDDIVSLYSSSGISRPINNKERISKMYQNSNLVISAWDNDIIVGVARALTDFSYCCYLSDLAINKYYQHSGIGTKLIEIIKSEIGEGTMLLLLSAPNALDYYPKLKFENVNNGFIIKRKY